MSSDPGIEFPISDEPAANRNLVLHEPLTSLPRIPEARVSLDELRRLSIAEVKAKVIETAKV